MNHTPIPFKLARNGFNATVAAALLACAFSANAALFTFAGSTDSGPLTGANFSGSFSTSDPLPADGSVDLNAFTLSFAGQAYTLATSDVFTTPVAWFASGNFIGVDYIDIDAADPGARPWVQMVAGFTDFGQAFFAYDATTTSIDGAGFGSYAVTAVPEPGSMALVLSALGLLSAVAHNRRR